MESKTYVQSQLNKENVKSFPSFYKNILISPIGGGWTQTISNSPNSIIFEIPQGIYNFWRCSLEFTFAITANSPANNIYCIPTDYCSLIQSVQMYTSNSNVYLIDLQNVDIYSKSLASVLNYKKRSLNDGFVFQSERQWNQWGCSILNYVAAAPIRITNATGNFGNNLVITAGADTEIGANTTSGCSSKWDYIINCAANAITLAPTNPGTVDELSHFYYQKSATAQPFAATKFNIKLKDLLHDSFFVIDRDFYLASSMFLKIIFNTKDKIAFTISALNGVTLLAALNVITANTSDITLTNIKLMSYIQANPQLEMLIRESSNTTQEIIMPRVFTNSMAFQWSTNQNTTFRVNSIFESRLYKNLYQIIDTGCVNTPNLTNNLITTVDANRLVETASAVGRLFNFYQIYINNQLFLFHDVTSYEDYDYYKQYFKNSSLTNIKAYYGQGGVYTVFDSEPIKGEDEYSIVNYKGLEMPNNEQLFQYNFTTVANGTNNMHYLHSVLLSKLYYKSGLFFTMPPV